MTICALCFSSFESLTSYGLCASCYTRDTLREWDRIQTAHKEAKRKGVPAQLELRAWLAILSSFSGRCAYCQVHWYQHIEIVEANKGLVSGNVVPICMACREHKQTGWGVAVLRVAAVLKGKTLTEQGYAPSLFFDEEETRL